MSEEEMNDNLLMLKYFLKTECDENWEDYCNAINKALNLISNLQKENEELKEEVLDRKILMEQQQKELDKKDKVIDLMIEQIEKDTEWYYGEFDNKNTKEIKEYFFKKVEEENE